MIYPLTRWKDWGLALGFLGLSLGKLLSHLRGQRGHKENCDPAKLIETDLLDG